MLTTLIAGIALAPAAPMQTPSAIQFVVAEMGTPHHNDSYILPLSDPTHIRQARDLIRYGGMTHIAVCSIAAGADGINRDVRAPGEPLWNWHVTAFHGFADMTAEVMDGWPGLVESNPEIYVMTGIGFWSYTVTNELGAGPSAPPPTAPGSFSATVLSGGNVRLNWADNSNNEEGFEIERQKEVNRFWSTDRMISAAPNTVTHTDAAGPGSFRYRIRSYSINGSSTWSAWKSVRIR